MQVLTVRKPGDRQGWRKLEQCRSNCRERGTQKLIERFGDKLVCVRYRYDANKKKRYKTVELIVAEESWTPPAPQPPSPAPKIETHYTPRVGLRIRFDEPNLRQQVKSIGRTWDPSKRLWFAPEEYVKRIGLAHRIVR
jgi:hypothetical protein